MSGAFRTDGAASSTGLSIGTESHTGTASSIDTGIGTASRNGAASSTASELDNPVWAALTGPQSALGTVRDGTALFVADVSPFAAFRDASPTSADWAALRALAGTEVIALPGVGPASIPADWQIIEHIPCHQMISRPLPDADSDADSPQPYPHASIDRLTSDDVPSMLDLMARTEPGPFRGRTIATGRYLGIRDAGSLVAMISICGDWQQLVGQYSPAPVGRYVLALESRKAIFPKDQVDAQLQGRRIVTCLECGTALSAIELGWEESPAG